MMELKGEGNMIKAEWILDYNLHTDKNYRRPGCPECYAPVGRSKHAKRELP